MDVAMELAESTGTRMVWAAYQALGSQIRGEYIDGELVVSPSPTRPHQDIASNLWLLLREAAPDGVRVCQAWSWKPADDEFIPDVMVFDDTDEIERYTGTPHLCVEVLSTDRAADLFRKHRKYAAAGLPRCWIVDPDGLEIVVYELDHSGIYRERGRHSNHEEVSLDAGPMSVMFSVARLLD